MDLAKKANCPPTLMARLIVENVIKTRSTTCTTTTTTQPHAATHSINTSSNPATAHDATTYKKKLVSEALRYPEKNLGCASTSLLPEYLFSENAGRGGKRKKKKEEEDDNHDIHNNDMHDDDTQHIPLSRLSLEVREAVDLDPMYGKSLRRMENDDDKSAKAAYYSHEI